MSSLAKQLLLREGRLRPLLRVLVYALAVTFFSLQALLILALIPQRSSADPLRATAPEELALCVVAVACAIALRRLLDRRCVASLGFSFRAPWLRLLGLGALLGAGMQLLVFAMEEGFGLARITGYGSPGAAVAVIVGTLPLWIVSALFEEMPLRGYILQNLWEDFGFWPAATLTTGLFALEHLQNPHSHAHLPLTMAGLVAYGMWACLSLAWTRSLWLALGLHFTWNVFEGSVFGFPVSGVAIDHPAISQRVGDPAWFTGGAFGPEAGASSLIALGVGLAVLRAMHQRGAFADVPDEREPYAR